MQTFVSYYINIVSVFGKADGMVLHARAPANVAQHDDLHSGMGRGRGIAGGREQHAADAQQGKGAKNEPDQNHRQAGAGVVTWSNERSST